MERKIKYCIIVEEKYRNIVSVMYDDGSIDHRLGSYYPDEQYYDANDFIGLTEKQAKDLMHQNDVNYLRT